MEKEGAEKATTELDNSVTSKEDASLAETNENNNDVEAEKRLNSTDAEESSTTQDIKGEEMSDKDDSEGDNNKSSDDTTDSEVKPEAAQVVKEKPEESPSEKPAPESKEEQIIEEVPVVDVISEESNVPDTTETVESPSETVAKEDSPESEEAPAVDDVSIESSDSKTPKSEDLPLEGATAREEAAESSDSSETLDSSIKAAVSNEKADSATKALVQEDGEKKSSKEKSKKTVEKKAVKEDKKTDEHHDDHHHAEYQNADFSTYSKEELVEVIKKLGKEENPFLADRILKVIAPIFNQIRAQERELALKSFVKEGGAEDDFQYRPDELSLRFDANYKLIKDKKTKKFKEQDLERSKNLIIAEEVLNELRNFVDSEESSGSFNSFKAIQEKWKAIGDVPSQNSRTLWANYNALIHRFYDQRSIYFELKELDRKKNYESKLVLCDKAEALVDVDNLREAIKGLNDLHHEFKHLGPVPQEVQEELWQRFKLASDKVYERRKVFVNELKAELHENLVKKQELIEKIKLFVDFQSDRIKEWNEKTKELIALQKAWEKVGGLPKDKAKNINKEFWSSFKKFFNNKHLFFKKLDADRDEHLIKKQELLAQATALKDSEEWDKTANELTKLQNQWREIGPVPEKMRKKLYEEFKACCDHFFERRRAGFKNSQEDYKKNLKKKKEIVDNISKLRKDADKSLDKFNELRKEFMEVGFVPKKNINSIKEEYQHAVEAYLNDLTILNIKQKTEISLETEFASLASSEHSESELYHKEQSVRRQINKLEDDIALWQNNLEFFAHSKSTDKLREEVNKKIDDATLHMDSLKRQLKMLRTL